MTLRLNGSTSGYVEIDAPAVAANNTLILPGGNGSANERLVTNGSGTLSWSSDVMLTAGSAASPSLYFSGDTNTGIWSPGADTLAWSTNGTEVARINSDSQFLVGVTSVASNQAGTIGAKGLLSRSGYGGSFSTNTYNIFWSGSSAQLWIDTTNQGAITTSSDYRIKKEIVPIESDCIERIKKLRPVEYEFTDYGTLYKADGIRREGFIAHEVQEVIPSGAEGQKDQENRIQNLRTDAIVAVLTKALQQAVAKIESLESRIAALEVTP